MTIEPLRLPVADVEVVQNLNDHACKLREARKYEAALVALKRALAMDPMQHAIWANIGCTYWNMGRFDEALEPMRRATFLAPNHGPNWGNLALLYSSMRRFDESEAAFAKCVEHAPSEKDRMGVVWDRGLMRLERGDWERGLDDYEVRIPLKGPELYPGMPAPTWQGEPLDGKTLYVQAEQGIGDRLLFSRYFTVIKERWPTCRIIACMNERLADIFWEFRHIVEFMPAGVPWPDQLDYGVYQASLPRHLSRSPDLVPPDPGLVAKRVEKQVSLGGFRCPEPRGEALKVGIAWTGNPEMQRNDERSIPLAELLTLAEDPRVYLYGFQVGPGQEQIAQLGAGELICDLSADLAKYGLVSAGVAMKSMDLVITVCTSTAHLAGVLGVPTWVLLCYDPYWVWLQDGQPRSTSIWYPSARLFRQSAPNDWASVLTEVKAELKRLVDAREEQRLAG